MKMKRRLNFKNQQYNKQLESIPYNFGAVHNNDEGITELTIYGDIGESWWYDSTSAADVDNALKDAGKNDIVVNLSSPGGDAFDGIAIYNRLKNHMGKVTIKIDGYACSAASIIAMAADELIMNTGSMLMIHEAWTIAMGSKSDMQHTVDMLSKLDSSLIDIYMTKAKVTREEIEQFVKNETWFTASEAIDIGFATEATNVDEKEIDAEAFKQSVLNRFKREPEPQQQQKNILAKFKRNS